MASRAPKEAFLASPAFGVVGASRDRNKFGNKVLRKYLQHGLHAYPVNPKEKKVESIRCYATVADLPDEVQSLSIVTPPEVTEQIVKEAVQKGIRNLWMQPGAESEAAVEEAQKHGLNVIADGSCILVELG